jgi:hypothetical protein
MSTIALLQAIATFMLLVWTPTEGPGQAIRLALFVASGFFAGVFLLAGLFTLWWPPKQPFVVLWSTITFALLFLMMVRSENR